MNFLPDVYVPCEICHGARYNRETLEVHFKGKTIAEVLDMPIEEAARRSSRRSRRSAGTCDARRRRAWATCGSGQPAPTLSGGEAQRVKLAAELQKRQTGRTIYVLDEPTTGPALRGHPQAARRARPARRPGQLGDRHRAQPRRHQDRGLGHRHGARGRVGRRHGRRPGHPGAGRAGGGLAHRALPARTCCAGRTPDKAPGAAAPPYPVAPKVPAPPAERRRRSAPGAAGPAGPRARPRCARRPHGTCPRCGRGTRPPGRASTETQAGPAVALELQPDPVALRVGPDPDAAVAGRLVRP